MHRTRAACWVLLLAILFGASSRAGGPRPERADSASVQAAAPPSDGAYYLRTAVKLHQALETRAPGDRTPPSAGALASGSLVPGFPDLQFGAPAPPNADRPAPRARRLTLFPTGPPPQR